MGHRPTGPVRGPTGGAPPPLPARGALGPVRRGAASPPPAAPVPRRWHPGASVRPAPHRAQGRVQQEHALCRPAVGRAQAGEGSLVGICLQGGVPDQETASHLLLFGFWKCRATTIRSTGSRKGHGRWEGTRSWAAAVVEEEEAALRREAEATRSSRTLARRARTAASSARIAATVAAVAVVVVAACAVDARASTASPAAWCRRISATAVRCCSISSRSS